MKAGGNFCSLATLRIFVAFLHRQWYNQYKSAVCVVWEIRNPQIIFGSDAFAGIGKVCIYTESPNNFRFGAPTCEKRVNTFS